LRSKEEKKHTSILINGQLIITHASRDQNQNIIKE